VCDTPLVYGSNPRSYEVWTLGFVLAYFHWGFKVLLKLELDFDHETKSRGNMKPEHGRDSIPF